MTGDMEQSQLGWTRRRDPMTALAVSRLAFWLIALGGLLTVTPAHAYAWMIRHGFAECGGCHVDPMGGETLTGMGRVTGERLLALPWSEAPPTDLAKFAFGVTEPDAVRLGGSLRGMLLSDRETSRTVAFPMQVDLYGAAFFERFTVAASFGYSRASDRFEHASKARLLGDLDDEGALLVSRNHWLGYSLDDQLMLRGGRINLPFGIRGPEHTAWVRAETLTDRESDQLHGVSAVYSAGPLRGEFMAALGNLQVHRAAFQWRGYSTYLEWLLLRRLALGASSMMLWAPRELDVDRGTVSRQAHGLTLRYSPWTPLVLLAEADVLKSSHAGLGYVGMITLDIEPLRGLHLGASVEMLNRGKPDAGGGNNGDGTARIGKWLTASWFFGPHLDVRLDFVRRDQRADEVLAQLHVYL
jgi:hypothetical protein